MNERQLKFASNLQKYLAPPVTMWFSKRGIFATVTRADIGANLKRATIWIDFMGKTDKEAEELIEEINQHKSEFNDALVKNIKSKFTPKIEFKVDKDRERIEAIDKLIDDRDETD